ncbi:transcriptional regulator [Rhodopseudomonas sp. P2A-2r]|uniref:transcriptional regulator n=1 Tax=Rhodopseudomonas sp. P2A-2r TaxID=2991972 RepID=UPI0022347B26|nr:transcriptional regulator [Rhodopseudomonas sp. P2A-2r]UZE46996.1 transcriptional regulator [Rhodopseudomonas sp. P2A-2r]
MTKSPIEEYAEFRDVIWETDPHYKAFYGALIELNTETDRGIALVLTSFLDKILGEVLCAFFIDNEATKLLLVGFNAPLGTFNSRVAACHALGLISDDEAGRINIMRKVRNEFAHEIGVNFNEGRVKDLCNNLAADSATKPRDKFTHAGISILIPLLSRPKEVAEKRLTWGGWSQWTKQEI